MRLESRYHWVCAEADAVGVDHLARQLDRSPELARLLWVRGIREEAAARTFLQPSLHSLSHPDTLPDIDPAVDLIRETMERGESICIYGDYDVDGITAAALLVEMFRHLGVVVDCYVPHRLREGYGLNELAIRDLAARGTRLLITVDGGSNDHAELRLAMELGMRVIVTDHHPIRGELPDCPVVHPGRADRPAPFASLSGAGVAYKLVWALGQRLTGGRRVDPSYREFMIDALALVALGTVGDVVPLVGENRALVHYGLQALARTTRPGLRALLEECRVIPGSVQADDIAFRLAPRLNAAGRVAHADLALELLLTKDEGRARQIAQQLGAANRERQRIESEMLLACEAQIEEQQLTATRRPLLVAGPGWHAGVAGIVAARLVDRYQRPVIVAALADGLARGSLRSVPELPLHSVYDAMAPEVISIGGHACAGGLTFDPACLERLRAVVAAVELPEAVSPLPTLEIDARVSVDRVGLELSRELAALGPHGEGNRQPRIQIDDLVLHGAPRLVGKEESHLSFSVRRKGPPLRAIFFDGASWARPLAESRAPFSVVGEIFENHFQGSSSAELRVVDLRGSVA